MEVISSPDTFIPVILWCFIIGNKSIPFTFKPFFVNELRLKMTEMSTPASKKGAK